MILEESAHKLSKLTVIRKEKDI